MINATQAIANVEVVHVEQVTPCDAVTVEVNRTRKTVTVWSYAPYLRTRERIYEVGFAAAGKSEATSVAWAIRMARACR